MGDSDKPNEEALNALLDMGFSEEDAKKALQKFKGNSDQAVEFLVNKEESDAKKPEGASEAPKVVRSYICTDTGKVFRTMRDAELYAERTGHTNFEESDIEVPPLTEEEKAEKVKQLREKIEAKRKEREANAKIEELAKEKERRRGGQEMLEMREEMEKQKRLNEIELRKREKLEEKLERERLREKIAQDKAERAAARARERGEDPKAAYDEAYNAYLASKQQPAKSAPEDRIEKALSAMNELDAGKTIMDTLKKMISNIIKSPDDQKFRKVRLSNEGFQKRVGKYISGIEFMKACGFETIVEDNEKYLHLSEDNLNIELLEKALAKLDAALK